MNGASVQDMPRGERIAALRSSPLSVSVLRGGTRLELSMSLDCGARSAGRPGG